MKNFIPLHKAHIASRQLEYIEDAIHSGKLSSQGKYSNLCESYFKDYFKGSATMMTHSCTDALELISIIIGIKEGDEVIVPSFTFVSTANAFMLRGARIVWADSLQEHPNVSTQHILSLITPKTKAIVVVHYAGCSVDMGELKQICDSQNIILIEDAAQALNSHYHGKVIGSLGHFACFSFHDTKPISCGEGGLLVINDSNFVERAFIALEKGTDRHAFLQGQVNKYQWRALGSSFAASQLQAACLFAQIKEIDWIFEKRKLIWNAYMFKLNELAFIHEFKLPFQYNFTAYNTSIFYIELFDLKKRNELLKYLNQKNIGASFHYLALHQSPMVEQFAKVSNPNAEYWTNHILRLPIHTHMELEDVEYIVQEIKNYFNEG